MSYAFASPGRPPAPPFGSPYGSPSMPPGAVGRPRPMRRFLASLGVALIVGVVELLVLMAVGRWIGPAFTVLLMIATSVLGVWLLRREGARSWRAFRADLSERRPPGPSATEGLLVLVGGVLMVLPGFVTDLVGAVLVTPPTRRLVARWAQSALARRLTPSAATSLFGPRTVRVRTGPPTTPPRQPGPAEADSTAPGPAGEPIEGEIIDPR